MNENKLDIYRRIKGAIIGVAYGDAMGMPTEMLSREKIKETYPEGIHTFLPSDPNLPFGRVMKPGEITDDTINTVMVIDMLRETNGKITAENYVKHLIHWIKTSDKSDYVSGPSTLAAIEKIKNGLPIEESGVMGTTNGAQMKITPIGAISDYKKMVELVENVSEISKPTHNTSIAIQGASAVAAAVSYAVHNDEADYMKLWNIADEAIQVAKGYGFDHPTPSLEHKMALARKIADEHVDVDTTLDKLYYEVGTSLDTIQTVPAVFAIIQIAKGQPEVAASLSAMVGYDTDTIGAIASSICGAINPDFSKEDVSLLENTNDLNFDEMTEVLYKIVENK